MRPNIATIQPAAHQLLEPSYENRLRVIGRVLDKQLMTGIALVEFEGGFVARGIHRDKGHPIVLELLDADFPTQVDRAIQARGEGETPRPSTSLLPTGYEDFLRALGHELDLRIAEGVAIAEFASFITVCALVPGFDEAQYVRYAEVIGESDVREILDEAFRRRGSYEPITHYKPARHRRNEVAG